MIFKTPWMLLLLAVLPILGGLLARAGRLQEEAAEKLRGKRGSVSNQFKKQNGLSLCALAALILALAQPRWNPRQVPVTYKSRDLAILLDISRSMLAADVFPTRLEAAKITLFESLPALRGQRIGLITFAGAATVRVPLTHDHHFVRYMLERSAPSDAEVGGTSLQAAIEKAVDTVLSGTDRGRQDLILFTDGEDHISDVEKTAGLLSECGARVLIIGLGDPVEGARIPDPVNTNAWMQYKGEPVITRLDEATLHRLADGSPNLIYYSAGTRPFDLLPLYRQMIADTAALSVGGGTETVWTEGYRLLIALALVLWLVPFIRNIRSWRIITLLLLTGCSPHGRIPETENFKLHAEHGAALWMEAQPLIHTDPRAALPVLQSAREEFLRAALFVPGHLQAARQIAGLSEQIRSVTASIQAQEESEQDRQRQMEEALALLQELVRREAELARRSQQILTRRPPIPPEERTAAAAESLVEQESVREGTLEVLNIIEPYQQMIQQILKMLYGEKETPPPTEFDPAVELLRTAVESQQTALRHLAPDAINWPQANPALRVASAKMQQALESLSNQGRSRSSQEESEPSGDEQDWDFEDDAEWDESSQSSDLSMPMSSQSFKTALENRSMPIPNYTAEEILMEEAAHQEQRAQQKAGRASQAEKNW